MTVNDEPTADKLRATTFGNESRLPTVPLPALEDSCERFLRWCEPLLTGDELTETATAVARFLDPQSPARDLQAALSAYDEQADTQSWLDEFWRSRYLGRRDRIALNANFFFLFGDTDQGQIERATGIITGALDYKQALDAEEIPPLVRRGQPLSMEQNKFLFATTRIPGVERDSVRAPYSAAEPGPATARHIVVFRRGTIFRLDVIDPDGHRYPLADLAAGLEEIATHAPEAEVSPGSLTTKARAAWARSRARLSAEPVNAAHLNTIETALFCLALEDITPEDALAASDQLLHGNSANRWFDKAVTFIVFADGRAGINTEHCELDGTTVLGFVDAVLEVADGVRVEHRGDAPPHNRLEFVLDDAQRDDIADAAAEFAQYAADTATTLLSLQVGSDRAKELGVSPDALVQLAYQLAHKRSKGFAGATYESIATRHFRHGRTEAMRVVTPEVARFVEVMDTPNLDDAVRDDAVRAAATAHTARARDCQVGRAPEQHLWELQWIAARRGSDLGLAAQLYSSPGWTIMRDDYLSTSSAPSERIQYFGFGMTSSTCIGVGYVLLPDRLAVYLSTPRAVGQQMHLFADNLIQALHELVELLARVGNIEKRPS